MLDNKKINISTPESFLSNYQKVFGGTITEAWGDHLLTINNKDVQGYIRYVNFRRGIHLLIFDLVFTADITLNLENHDYNPIEFLYCLKGGGIYKNHDGEITKIEPYHSLILARKKNESSSITFEKKTRQHLTIIQLERKKFLKDRSLHISKLNEKLVKLFMVDNHEGSSVLYNITNISMADDIEKMQSLSYNGLAKVLYLDGIVHQVLYKKLIEHDKALNDNLKSSTLRKNELEVIRNLSQRIIDEPAKNYNLKELANETGLSQIKLQEGFKLLFARTVNDFIRHTRLKNAKNLLHNPEYNISEVVYAVGLSSRSYFSKIFKQKFGIKPSEYQARLRKE